MPAWQPWLEGGFMRKKHFLIYVTTWSACFLLLNVGLLDEVAAGPEDNQNIRKLLEQNGGIRSVRDQISQSLEAFRVQIAKIAPDSAKSVRKDIDDHEIEGLIEQLVAVYEKHLTDEEISTLLKFGASPVGKKISEAMPVINSEVNRIGREWALQFAQKVIGQTIGLIGATGRGDAAMVTDLLASGADVNSRDPQGLTALIVAAFGGNVEIASLLVEKGAGVNARTNEGATPLMAAVQSGNKELVQLFLNKGADANAKDDQGLNAYQLASLKGAKDIAAVLKDKSSDTRSVKTQFVIGTLGAAKGCLPVLNVPEESGKRIKCLKLGEQIAPSDITTNNGWTLIQQPAIGWIPQECVKTVFVTVQENEGAARRTPAARSPESESVPTPDMGSRGPREESGSVIQEDRPSGGGGQWWKR
jgi:hypothetical protein